METGVAGIEDVSQVAKEYFIVKRIKVAVIGCGNCFSSLLQGLEYYASAPHAPGLIRATVGSYDVRDIDIVAVFDVNERKIGKDIAEAIHIAPNNAQRFTRVRKKGVLVSPGFLGDGLAPNVTSEKLFPYRGVSPSSVVRTLKKSGAEICVSFLPTGSKIASRTYAEACIDARVAFINGIPEFICSDTVWAEKFRRAGLPCAGDDWMSGVGATIVNRILAELAVDRGEQVNFIVQLNRGNNMDFHNLLHTSRIKSKTRSKAAPLTFDARTSNVIAGPSQYDRSLKPDQKLATITLLLTGFGGRHKQLDVKLLVEDSPNAAPVAIETIFLMKLSLDRGLSGYQSWSAWYFKHPMQQLPLAEGKALVDAFIAGKS